MNCFSAVAYQNKLKNHSVTAQCDEDSDLISLIGSAGERCPSVNKLLV